MELHQRLQPRPDIRLRSTQQTQNNCITYIQCWTNVEDVGPTLHKCYTSVVFAVHAFYFLEIPHLRPDALLFLSHVLQMGIIEIKWMIKHNRYKTLEKRARSDDTSKINCSPHSKDKILSTRKVRLNGKIHPVLQLAILTAEITSLPPHTYIFYVYTHNYCPDLSAVMTCFGFVNNHSYITTELFRAFTSGSLFIFFYYFV